MLNQPTVAIVILNWNGKKFLEQFLPSVLASTYSNKRIIVADNASTDESVAFVSQQFPEVEVLTSTMNLGFAGGYNFFLKQIEADYYILLNSDVEVKPDWIEPVIQLMETDYSIAACQPKILSFHNKHLFEYAGSAGGWIDSLGYPFSRGRVFDELEEDKGQYDDISPVFWASGAAMFIRAKLFHDMGGFDKFFFAHQEEIDLCWRLQRSGYHIYTCPRSVVYHVGGGTLPAGNPQKVFLNFRNNLIMITRNMPLSQLVWKLPVRIALDALSAWKELFIGKPGYWLAVFKAHFSFFLWIFSKKTVYLKGYHSLKAVYNGSIVWQYFIKRKRKFSEIVDRK